MTEQWPFWKTGPIYRMTVEIRDDLTLEFDLSLPAGVSEVDMATVRLGRHGGDAAADYAFRAQLYTRIGAVAVAGGHAETAMKRMLALLTGRKGHFSDVDMNWSDLAKALRVEASKNPTAPGRENLGRVLAWADAEKVKQRRDDVIHAYWWIYEGCGVSRSRFFRKKDGPPGAQMTGSLEALEKDAELLFEYARRLDDLLGDHWAQAMLPRLV